MIFGPTMWLLWVATLTAKGTATTDGRPHNEYTSPHGNSSAAQNPQNAPRVLSDAYEPSTPRRKL